nr:hypothetical protein [Streptomyces atriruber]
MAENERFLVDVSHASAAVDLLVPRQGGSLQLLASARVMASDSGSAEGRAAFVAVDFEDVQALYPSPAEADAAADRVAAFDRSCGRSVGWRVVVVTEDFDPLFTNPHIPRPDLTVESMRATVERLDPSRLVQLDADARRGEPTFLPAWSLWVERNRFPEVMRRVHELEVAMGQEHTLEGGRAIAGEMSELLYTVSDRLPWARKSVRRIDGE